MDDIARMDFHGCYLTVTQTMIPGLLNKSGIVAMETMNTFTLVDRQDKSHVVPKRRSVFSFVIEDSVFCFMSTSQLLLNPEEDISKEDEEFWSSLMSKVNLGEQQQNQQQQPTNQVEVAPRPSFCIKTKNKEETKVFLNICTHDDIPAPKKMTVEELVALLESEDDMAAADYRIPMSIGEQPHAELSQIPQDKSWVRGLHSPYLYPPPTTDFTSPFSQVDKKGAGCTVYDIVINTGYVKTLKEESVFLNFFLQVVYQGLDAKFSVSCLSGVRRQVLGKWSIRG
eukprot:sb/3467840/